MEGAMQIFMNRDKQQAKLAEKMARFHTSPQDWFRKFPELYSRFDDTGLPTHDAAGIELSKSTTCKLKKDWEKQNKLYNTSKENSF